MKNLILTIILGTIFSTTCFSQSVSIDPNGLQLPRFTVNPGCTNNDKGKLIYNTVENTVLYCDGNGWRIIKQDSVFSLSHNIGNIAPVGGNGSWQFVAGNISTKIITVDGSETIIGNFVGSFGHSNQNSTILLHTSLCYQNINGGQILPINNFYPFTTIPESPKKTTIAVTGAVKLPAGTYRVGMGVKNTSSVVGANLDANTSFTGYIEVKY